MMKRRIETRTAMTALAGAALMAAAPALAQDGAAADPYPPAFDGQTDAPAPAEPTAYTVETIATGLQQAFSFVPLPDGDFLIAERTGTMRIVRPDGFISHPLDGVPEVKFGSASGLHDVILAPDFAQSRLVYFTYFAPPEGERGGRWPRAAFGAWNARPLAERIAEPAMTETVARARLNEDKTALADLEILAEGAARRLAFGPDGALYVTGAERYSFTEDEWDVDGGPGPLPRDVRIQYSGRVLRINPDGSIPADNPYAGGGEGAPETFSFGHRDPQGAAFHPETGELWMVEHGPMGGDELNIVRAGRDYGWPNVSYGLQYTGDPVADGQTAGDGYEQPIYTWTPSIGPASLLFYNGEAFPDWQGDLLVGSMPLTHLVRLELDGERIVAEESLLGEMEQRIRDFDIGPDGALYFITDETALYRLVAK